MRRGVSVSLGRGRPRRGAKTGSSPRQVPPRLVGPAGCEQRPPSAVAGGALTRGGLRLPIGRWSGASSRMYRGREGTRRPGEAPLSGRSVTASRPEDRPHGSHTFGLGRVGQTLGRIFQRREEGESPRPARAPSPTSRVPRGRGSPPVPAQVGHSLSDTRWPGWPSDSWFFPPHRGEGREPARPPEREEADPSVRCPRRCAVSGFHTNPTGEVGRPPPVA